MVKMQIALCMGSACFARGNFRLLEALEEAIERNAWQDRVTLTGSRCENCCGKGPNIRIDGHPYHGLDAAAVLEMISDRIAAAQM